MALKQCKECGHRVSGRAKACPGCGTPNPTDRRSLGCGLVTALILFFGFRVCNNPSTPPYKSGQPQSPVAASTAPSFRIVGTSGVFHFVEIDSSDEQNEDVFRSAAALACESSRVCQVQFWVGGAPRAFPLTDAQVNSKVAQWQLNLNTGLREWVVNCKISSVFLSERQCM
jgi:hypothetical protein